MRVVEVYADVGILLIRSITNTQNKGEATSVKNRNTFVWLWLLVTVIVVVSVYAVNWQNDAQRTAVQEWPVGPGMEPDLMTLSGDAQILPFSPEVWQTSGGTSVMVEFRSNNTVCTVEDIFGSREAYLAMFDSNEDEAVAKDETIKGPPK